MGSSGYAAYMLHVVAIISTGFEFKNSASGENHIGGILSTVIAHWTVGQQVEHQGLDY